MMHGQDLGHLELLMNDSPVALWSSADENQLAAYALWMTARIDLQFSGASQLKFVLNTGESPSGTAGFDEVYVQGKPCKGLLATV